MNIDRFLQETIRKHMTLEDALPTRMPEYVNSFGYFFGTATLSSLAVIFISGIILAFWGPDWWHFTSVGHFTNSVHFWAVEVFTCR